LKFKNQLTAAYQSVDVH